MSESTEHQGELRLAPEVAGVDFGGESESTKHHKVH